MIKINLLKRLIVRVEFGHQIECNLDKIISANVPQLKLPEMDKLIELVTKELLALNSLENEKLKDLSLMCSILHEV